MKDQAQNKFHQPHTTPHGHSFAIDDHGLAIQIDIGKGPQELTGKQAQHLREWLSKCELRTQDQHDAIQADAKANPPKEVNPGIKVEMNDATVMRDGRLADDGTHKFALNPDQLEEFQAEAAKNRAAQLDLIKARTKKPN